LIGESEVFVEDKTKTASIGVISVHDIRTSKH